MQPLTWMFCKNGQLRMVVVTGYCNAMSVLQLLMPNCQKRKRYGTSRTMTFASVLEIKGARALISGKGFSAIHDGGKFHGRRRKIMEKTKSECFQEMCDRQIYGDYRDVPDIREERRLWEQMEKDFEKLVDAARVNELGEE